ncbi:MAG: sodium:proton antiporter NhaD [Muribaculaceae bacterium]|nr:sodium:proton antiporter NhaD [Muribaculaceae bacterium]
MILTLIIIFFIGYLAIAFEHPLRIDKSALALLLGMTLWIVYALNCDSLANPDLVKAYVAENGHAMQHLSWHEQCMQYILNVDIVESLGEIAQTLLFLIGAMTIVELIDVHGGFTVITDKINTRNKRLFMWVICGITFILSAILDNMTTTIVMVMLLRKLVADKNERWIYAAMIVIAANTGGAWSPIGDVTTILLWVKGNVTATALIKFVLLPSVVAMIIPLIFASKMVKGELSAPMQNTKVVEAISLREKRLIFFLGVGGLIFVPVFKSLTHLPPFIGILLVLGVLWTFTEMMYNGKMLERSREHRLPKVIARIDMPSILFFLGILMAVSVLQSTGILKMTAEYLDDSIHNVYIINILLGALSSVVDNVPLVAGVIGMYPVEMHPDVTGYAANFVIDGAFWEFLSYCAGVGGSLLIIGSAAGVIAMGLERINFGWYLKRFSLLALAGYLAGAGVYILEVYLFK